MPEEISEELKEKIAAKYKEIKENDTVENAAEELGVSKGSFLKYKDYKPEVKEEEKEDDEDEKEKDFEDDFKEDEKEDEKEDDDEDDDDEEEIHLVIEP
jgi:hypothetical protein